MEEVLKCEKVSQVRGATVGSDFAARRADAPGEPRPSSRILIHMPRKDELCSCVNVVNVFRDTVVAAVAPTLMFSEL